ncbi:MAG: hypothetical protein E7559_02795 [Ruminococcaceae bacterium]|nr:hypothetical protein [Oscillospiraceae bacterium]
MSLIPCSSPCYYQREGLCTLETGGCITCTDTARCPHYVNKSDVLRLPSPSMGQEEAYRLF